MGRIPDEDVRKVRDATDLVALVSERVVLRKKGRLLWGLCPFHSEKTPSFKVDPGTQLWYCFGCSEGGDAIGFLMKTENMEFAEAVRYLADRARIEIREEGGEGLGRGRRERLVLAAEAAADFYHLYLTTAKDPQAREARDYLKSRGFGSDVAKRFRLGLAPSGPRDALSRELTRQGFSRDELVEANLALAEGAGGLKDRFFGRIMFPIDDLSGKVIAFGGRILGEGQPKYLNSQETPIFHKSANMYGLHKAKNTIVTQQGAIVVEGYTDVISLHEAGVGNAVATLGTALTGQHVKLLARFAPRVTYLFDGDAAGQRAARRAEEFLSLQARPEYQALSGGAAGQVEFRVAVIPEGKDPADFAAEKGGDGIGELVEHAVPLVRFVLDARMAQHDPATPEGRAAALSAAAGVLAGLRNSVLVHDYTNYVAGKLLVDYTSVQQAMSTARPEVSLEEGPEEIAQGGTGAPGGAGTAGVGGGAGAVCAPPAPLDKTGRAEEELLRLLFVAPDLRGEARGLLAEGLALSDPGRQQLLELVLGAGDAGGTPLFDLAREHVPSQSARVSAWLVDGRPAEDSKAMFREILGRLKEYELERQIIGLQARMERTDPVADRDAYDGLFREVAALLSELKDARRGFDD